MIDLQIHTTDSDGTWPWDQALQHCLAMGLTAYAITDHDTILRQEQIRNWAKKNKALAIPGVEMSTNDKGQTVHLLGYFLEGPLDKLESELVKLRAARNERNSKIIGKLQQFGFKVTDQDLEAIAGRGSVGRPHIARLLFERRYVQSMKEAFDRFLAVGAQAYFPKEEIPLRDGIDLLHGAGAVTSVAHPLLMNRPMEELEGVLDEWRGWGLDAIEAIYASYRPEQSIYLQRLAQKHDLLITGGSDFHGENKPQINIGVGMGDLNVPDAVLEPLLARKDQILSQI